MPVKIIDGDLFSTTANYICHQVNCQGRMGSGVAKIVRDRYPKAYELYLLAAKQTPVQNLLGYAQFVPCSDGKTIINMFAQNRYGYDGARYTDYNAFRSCLSQIRDSIPHGATIAMPFKIGCGLGGGNWNTVSSMIVQELSDYNVEFWRL